MKRKILSALFSILIPSTIYANTTKKNEVEIPRCVVKFKFNSSVVDDKILNQCVKEIDLTNVLFIDIFAASTPEGGLKYNQKLSEKRALNIKKLLGNTNIPIHIKNGGSSFEFGRQGIVTFLLHKYDEPVMTKCTLENQLAEKNQNQETTKIEEKINEVSTTKNTATSPLNAVYFGLGVTFILSTPLSNYVESSMITYNIGLSHTLKSFKLLGEDANFYIGGDLTLAHSLKTLPAVTSGSTIISQKSDVRYVRNNYSMLFGLDRELRFLKNSYAFLELGPALQERVFILSVTTGPAQNGYVSKEFGLIGNIGLKYKFLENSTLNKIGIDNLFVRAALTGSYGQSMETDTISYKQTPERIDINQFAWGALLSLGANY